MKLFRILGFLLTLAVGQRVQAQTATVTWTTVFQTMDGWGASTGWQERNLNLTAAQADCFFSVSNGSCASGNSIGLEWIRIQDNTSTLSAPDLPTLQLAVARGAKVFITFGYGSFNGATTASAMVSKIQFLQSNGVPIAYLSPENEPDNPAFAADALRAFIVSFLKPALTAAGLSIQIIMPENAFWFDTTCPNCQDWTTPCMTDASCSASVPIVAGHGYTSTPQTLYFAQDWASCCAVYPNHPPPSSAAGKRVWMTEIAGGFSGPCTTMSGYAIYDASINDGIVWARNIHDFLTIPNGSAWMYWNLAGQTAHGLPGCNDGLTDTSLNPAKRFYVVGNWSKFVRPGWVRIDATVNPQPGVTVTAFKNPAAGENFAIVAVNTNSNNTAITFSLSGFPTSPSSVTPWITSSTLSLAQQTNAVVSGGSFTYTLPAYSVTSLVGNTTTTATAPAPPTQLTVRVQ